MRIWIATIYILLALVSLAMNTYSEYLLKKQTAQQITEMLKMDLIIGDRHNVLVKLSGAKKSFSSISYTSFINPGQPINIKFDQSSLNTSIKFPVIPQGVSEPIGEIKFNLSLLSEFSSGLSTVLLLWAIITPIVIMLAVHEKKSKAAELKLLKLEAQKNLALEVAHDLRSPLTVLKQCEKIFKDNDDNANFNILFEKCILRIEEICESLLLKNRQAKFQEFDIKKACLQILEEKSIKFKAQKISVSTKIEGLSAYGDKNTFNRVLSNVIDNAYDAIKMSSSYDKNLLSIHSGQITIKTALENERICIQIIDNGGGISSDSLNAIMKGIEHTTKLNGNGLGVISSIKSMREMQGDLVISKLGDHSTSVKIYLQKSKSLSGHESKIVPNNKMEKVYV